MGKEGEGRKGITPGENKDIPNELTREPSQAYLDMMAELDRIASGPKPQNVEPWPEIETTPTETAPRPARRQKRRPAKPTHTRAREVRTEDAEKPPEPEPEQENGSDIERILAEGRKKVEKERTVAERLLAEVSAEYDELIEEGKDPDSAELKKVRDRHKGLELALYAIKKMLGGELIEMKEAAAAHAQLREEMLANPDLLR